jgi:Na+/H+-dicarboxylate symporter
VNRYPLHWQIVAALGLAVFAGLATRSLPPDLADRAIATFSFAGSLFLQALTMLIVPLIVSSIISGVATAGGGGLGRLGGKIAVYFTGTTLLAVLVGLTVANVIEPGVINGTPVKDRLGLSASTDEVASSVAQREVSGLADVFLRMVPPNIVMAAAEGQMLGLIVFSLLFGAAIAAVDRTGSGSLVAFWKGTFEVLMTLTGWLLRLLPVGVFALVANVVATTGFDAVRPLAYFFATVVTALAVHAFIVLPALLWAVARVNPVSHFRAMASALVTAFSTSSSSATLPVTIECLEQRAGVSTRTTSIVAPLGATVNMDGTALYECVAALFIAQAYGLDLNVATQATVVLLAVLTSIGVAGIPAASLVAIVIILGAIGLPAESVGLILAVDRLLDMSRTAVNVLGDTVGTVLIARSEGERPYHTHA